MFKTTDFNVFADMHNSLFSMLSLECKSNLDLCEFWDGEPGFNCGRKVRTETVLDN